MSNVLVNNDCSVKLCDFGLSRTWNKSKDMSSYVVTRWYRAPEIMLGCRNYGTPIDVWGVGCIFGQLLCGEVLFPGQDYLDMVSPPSALSVLTSILDSPYFCFRWNSKIRRPFIRE